MYKVIEDFSVKVPVVNPRTHEPSTDSIKLVIEQWNLQTLVAYTYDSSSENAARQLYKALQKYQQLYFACETDDWRENCRIHKAMREHMKRLYGSKIKIGSIGKRDDITLFKMAKH